MIAAPETPTGIAAREAGLSRLLMPAFSGMRVLFSPKLMFLGLLLLTVGCSLRVGSEILAYRELAQAAWQ